jgi:hypothetical protein
MTDICCDRWFGCRSRLFSGARGWPDDDRVPARLPRNAIISRSSSSGTCSAVCSRALSSSVSGAPGGEDESRPPSCGRGSK